MEIVRLINAARERSLVPQSQTVIDPLPRTPPSSIPSFFNVVVISVDEEPQPSISGVLQEPPTGFSGIPREPRSCSSTGSRTSRMAVLVTAPVPTSSLPASPVSSNMDDNHSVVDRNVTDSSKFHHSALCEQSSSHSAIQGLNLRRRSY